MNYYPGEPDDLDSGQACIQILAGRQDYTGSWDDGNCSTPQDFICKKPAGEKNVLLFNHWTAVFIPEEGRGAIDPIYFIFLPIPPWWGLSEPYLYISLVQKYLCYVVFDWCFLQMAPWKILDRTLELSRNGVCNSITSIARLNNVY